MNDLRIFLTTKIEDHGVVAGVGNFFLTPVRYLWNGYNLKIIKSEVAYGDNLIPGDEVHSVKSFHQAGSAHKSWTRPEMTSGSRNFLKTALAVIFLVPSLILGSLFKGGSYLVIEKNYHQSIKFKFTPAPRLVGSFEKPLSTDEISNRFDNLKRQTFLHQKTTTLVIYGKEGSELINDPGLDYFRPKKIILVDVKLSQGFAFNFSRKISLAFKDNIKYVKDALDDAPPAKGSLSIYQVNA